MRRVVITGLGIVSPLGCGVEASWKRLLAGESGARRITEFDVSDLSCQIGCTIPRGDYSDGAYDPDDWMEPKEQRKVDDFIVYAMAAAQQAANSLNRPSPQAAAPPPAGPPPLPVQDQWFAAVNGKDMAEMDRILTDDTAQDVPFNESGVIEWPKLRRAGGRADVLEYWRVAWKKERHVDVRVEDLVEAKDLPVVFAEATGHHVMADGKPYENRYIFRFDLRDGRIARAREYYNPVNTARAFGRPIAAG